MAENSKIEWTDSTFSPWIGCQKVSPGCDFCYAEDMMDKRYKRVQWGPHGERIRTSQANWKKPLQWQRKAAEFKATHGRRQRVFCSSLADVFDNKAPIGAFTDLLWLIHDTPDLDWLLLTKRPENILPAVENNWDGEFPRNVWLGTTCEDQKSADHRVPLLLKSAWKLGVKFKFLSCEPLLEPINLMKINHAGRTWDALGADCNLEFDEGTISWVISGGESGPSARPSHPDWHSSLRDQCKAAGTAYMFKQWGSFGLADQKDGGDQVWLTDSGWVYDANPEDYDPPFSSRPECTSWARMKRMPKQTAGRMLDGREHNEFPED